MQPTFFFCHRFCTNLIFMLFYVEQFYLQQQHRKSGPKKMWTSFWYESQLANILDDGEILICYFLSLVLLVLTVDVVVRVCVFCPQDLECILKFVQSICLALIQMFHIRTIYYIYVFPSQFKCIYFPLAFAFLALWAYGHFGCCCCCCCARNDFEKFMAEIKITS